MKLIRVILPIAIIVLGVGAMKTVTALGDTAEENESVDTRPTVQVTARAATVTVRFHARGAASVPAVSSVTLAIGRQAQSLRKGLRLFPFGGSGLGYRVPLNTYGRRRWLWRDRGSRSWCEF